MGTYGREEIADLPTDAIAAFDERNVVIPIENIRSIHLEPSSWFRRSSLVVEWDGGEFDPESTTESDSQKALVESLGDHTEFTHVDVSVERSVF